MFEFCYFFVQLPLMSDHRIMSAASLLIVFDFQMFEIVG